jgi:hypothetical protein
VTSAVLVSFALACSAPSSTASRSAAPSVARADPPPGIPVRGYEPAVVSLAIDGRVVCAGTVVASDVVVTARHCVSALAAQVPCPRAGPTEAPAVSPRSISVRVGDDSSTATERARGRAILVPPGSDLCEGDIALVLLDSAIDDVAPLSVRPTGAAEGDHLRTVEWVEDALVLRDHVDVVATSAAQLMLHEPSSAFGAGGPALDEKTSAVVGVASRSRGDRAAATTVFVRTDAFATLFDQATAESAFGAPSARTHLLKAHAGPADMGATCTVGADCAAGACVAVDVARYCSRACGPRDRCPATFKCEVARSGGEVCVKT